MYTYSFFHSYIHFTNPSFLFVDSAWLLPFVLSIMQPSFQTDLDLHGISIIHLCNSNSLSLVTTCPAFIHTMPTSPSIRPVLPFGTPDPTIPYNTICTCTFTAFVNWFLMFLTGSCHHPLEGLTLSRSDNCSSKVVYIQQNVNSS